MIQAIKISEQPWTSTYMSIIFLNAPYSSTGWWGSHHDAVLVSLKQQQSSNKDECSECSACVFLRDLEIGQITSSTCERNLTRRIHAQPAGLFILSLCCCWPPTNRVWFLVPLLQLCASQPAKATRITDEPSNSQNYEAKAGHANAHLSSFCSRQIPSLRRTRFTKEAQRLSTTGHAERHSQCGCDKVRGTYHESYQFGIRYHSLKLTSWPENSEFITDANILLLQTKKSTATNPREIYH